MKQTTISTPLLSPFNGKTIVLELGREIGFKAKQELINYLREQKAYISYILTASTDYVLITNNVDSYKTRRAKQLGLPLVNVEYVYEYRRLPPGQTSIDISKFIIKSIEDQENFTQTGTISITGSRTNAIKINKFDLTKIKIWNSDDINLPRFDELTHCEIGKWAIFKETNDNSNVYFVLELQVIPEQYYDRITSDYRLRFRYEKQTIVNDGQQQNKKVLIQYAFSDDPNEQQQLFATYYYRVATMSRVTRIREMLPDKLGSKLLLRSLFTHRIDTQILDENACQLIESIWLESIGDLNKILSVPPESITLKTIIEAEAALLELKTTNDPRAALRFYSLIPHRSQYTVDLIKNRRVLTEKIDLCQMLRDMLTVNELTNWNVKAPIEAKYRALKCHIETIDNSTPEFNSIAELIQSSTDNGEQIVIHQIFNVTKQIDALNFYTSLSNQRQLFHGSKYANFLGILSRGLAMPKMVVEELGVVRTDIGCLGYGLYFSDSASTSLKYTTASTTRPGRRLLCICQVALGESANYYSFAPTLVKPSDGFHSTHGVKRTEENNSMFTDNEYAIYQLDQQRLLYIVEVSWAPNDTLNIEFERLPIIHHQQHALKLSEHVEVPMTIEDEAIEIAEQDYGLINPSSGKLVPLKSFHIRAQIVDTTVEVVLYQVYHNTSSIPIEAKYVFPLDENSTVCGFEAHINNKIIKGVVKEKEQAKQEYREAIEKGHGAYLMHQEQAQVFSVAVGNLPANNEVIIKITYVAELEIENDEIIFRLPAKMASWQSKQAIESKDQSIVRSIGIIDEKVEFSFKASIRMPYEIIKLFSPTHRLRRKLTDCIAMIELIDNVLLDRDFVLSITLRSANLPRISIETLSLDNDDNGTTITSKNDDSQACMLTFYPRFETLTNSNEQIELIFIIDVSNSMDGSYVQQAKQLAHLFLTNMKFDDRNIYFNIVTFGSDNDECFPISTPTTKENLDKAKHFVLHSLIHRGNTDLFAVLHRYSLLPALPTSKFGRQFIILSDGHIHDLQSILVLLEHQSTMRRDRIFACSIGNVANKHGLKQLVNGASGGGLTTVFDSNYRSKWKTKVLNILEQVRQPCVTNISINWHGHVDEQQKFNMQAPKIIRSLFNGMRLSVYRFIQNCHKATLTATIDGQEFVTTVFSSTMTTTKGRILHCLTARAIIDDYDNGLLHVDESENELMKVQYKQDLIDLSIKHSVVSAYTSFVAIEERDAKTDVKTFQPGVRLLDVMLDRNIDLLPYIGWDGDVSNLDTIKQKLIDERIPLESASIQSKKESIVDIEKLCEKISYRAGGDAKFDMMMTIIRTYRYALNEHEKANEIENKMRNDLKTEMISATTEERQTLQQRCQTNNLIIISDDDESSVDFDGKASGKKIPAPEPWALAALSDSSDEGDDMGFGCFDDYMPTASYSAARKMPAPGKDSLKLQPESDDESDDNFLNIFDDYVPTASCPASGSVPTPPPLPPSLVFSVRPSTSKQESSPTSVQLPKPEMLILPSATISHLTAKVQTASFSSQRLPAPHSLRPPPPPPPRPQFMHHSAAVRGRGGMSRPLPPQRDAAKTSIAFSEMPPPAVNQSLQQNFSLPQSTPHLETSAAPPPPPPPPLPPLPTTTATTSSFLLDNFDQAFVGGSSVSNQSSESADRLKRDELLDDISSCIAPSSLSIASPKKSYPTVSLKMKAASDEPRSIRGGCMRSSTAATQSAISTIGKRKNVETLQSKMKEVPTSNTSICDLLLLDVCPLGFGIEDIHGQMHTLIRRNTTIPTRTQFYSVFTNAYAYQTTATIRIFEGEHNLTKYNTLLGEFSLSGLTTNYAAQTLEISIRMDLDANGILHVDAEEARSAAKASFTFTPNNQQGLTADDIARHITYVNSDPSFTAKSVYNRIPNDPLYMLDGQTESIMHNFSGEPITSRGQTTSTPLFSKLKDVRSTTTMIEELFNLQSKDGSFTLNKDLADVFHIDFDIFHGLENYLRKQALNIRNDILRLIGTGVILIWLVLQTQASQQNTFQFLFNIEQIKVHLCSHLPANMSEQINKAIEFYQQTNQRNGIYCTQLELSDSSWNMFIQRILIGIDPVDN
ncbi:unnamed protein product [Rotaria sordida]|uniref:Poly [ADP-ribose] polymerase n=1 Tax=Rotaria sordida TaxID=392033 RepID=A0A814GSG1_9BILA|nr:unnamed protein product [Rotaria sordida]